MNFKDLLTSAKSGDTRSKSEILSMYKPLLVKESIVNGVFDEDLYQELCLTLLNCIRVIRV
jgi:hypothetical protein